MTEISDAEVMEKALAGQIPEAQTEKKVEPVEEVSEAVQDVEAASKNPASQYLGTKLNHVPGESPFENKDDDKKLVAEKKLSRVGDTIGQNADIRDGWIDVDRRLLGERDIFYPEDWRFRIRPATVEAIRNWSTIDEENPNSVDDVFNEIMKACVSILTPNGPIPWGNICSWDRFFFLLLVREYTFAHGEASLSYEEDCPECENPVKFELTSQTLKFDLPDPEVMPMYDREHRAWHIDPAEYDVDHEPITLYIPTLEKDANIKAWLIAQIQENQTRTNRSKIDQVFIRFVNWLSPKVSKDADVAKRQIKELNMIYKSWDAEMFGFMDDVIKNIVVAGSTKLTVTCPTCGEEVTSNIRFPHSVSDLFAVQGRRKKFGKK